MRCPLCNIPLQQALLSGVEVDYCPRCYGLWFEEEELRLAKDEKDGNLQWLDIDLWKDPEKLKISWGVGRACPADRLPLYEVRYGDSDVKVDVCNVCMGIWLDRGEFKSIVHYLREKARDEMLYHYVGNVAQELWEVFSGPELLKEEILDFLVVLKLLQYKFAAQHPVITQLILSLPR